MLRFVCALSAVLSSATADDFLWATAGASYQIEGAVNDDGRLPSIWDTFSHTAGKTNNGETGDVADDDYHRFEEDIQLAAGLGTNAYRFSIAWPRILPDGHTVNQAGIDHYNKVINTALAYNLKPLVTLYHWDLPQAIDDEIGGWLSEDIVDFFVKYAETCFENFGDRVKFWITFNEPLTFSTVGYDGGYHAPGRCSDRSRCEYGDSSTEPYIVSHNTLLSHAAACKSYHDHYQSTQDGVIGMTLSGDWAEPMTSSAEDAAAAQRNMLWEIGWYADPLYFGDYPQEMKDGVGDRLPVFTAEQSAMLKGSSDFYGCNEYTAKWVANKPGNGGDWGADQRNDVQPTNYNGTVIGLEADSSWLYVVPWGIRKVLNWIGDRYDNPPIYITENGVDCPGENSLPIADALNDTFRVNFYQGYIDNVMLAMKQDGVNIKGYTAWALLDNFEWADGYSKRFGMHYVDYNSANLTRYPKQSSIWYADYIKHNP